MILFWLALSFSFISLIIFLFSKVNYIKIYGKNNKLEFSIKNLSQQSLEKFVTALVAESNKMSI